MQKLFENWRKYLNEGMKQADELGYVVINDGGNDRIRFLMYGIARNDQEEYGPLLGHMWCTRLDWDGEDDDEKDHSIDCDDDVWVVTMVNAQKGFGPLLYDIALEWITDERRGVMMSGGHGETTGDVTTDAAKVWQYYFKNRSDVKKVKDPRCSDVLSPWILENPQLKPYHEALMHVYYKSKDILYDLEYDNKVEYD